MCVYRHVHVSPQQDWPRVCGAEPSRRQAPHGVKWQPPGHHWLMTVKTLAVNVKRGTNCHSQTQQCNPAICGSNYLRYVEGQNKKERTQLKLFVTILGIKAAASLKLQTSGGEKAEDALRLWSKYVRTNPLDCYKCHPRSDKLRTKCLASAAGQSYMVEVWEKDPGSLSTAASPQH